MTLILDYANLYRPRPSIYRRVFGAVRYAGVLTVWLGLFLIRPKLALEIFHNRRPDSPIPRF
jgi:hypothetical protein